MFRGEERRLQRLTLELGVKVFTKLDDASIAERCRVALDNWRRLIEDARSVTVLLWVGDGDEIYCWEGDEAAEVRYCNTVGFNNLSRGAYPPARHYKAWPAVPYIEHPPRMTYRDLRRIVAALKAAAKDMYGIDLAVGATVDAGPEFVESEFKFERHREIIAGGPQSNFPKTMAFICCYAKMKADTEEYAGFPGGIPEGTPFGTFLGRQFRGLAKAVGFDYIWFSNGFGLTHYAWSYLGECFDGRAFRAARAQEEIPNFLSFWKAFRAECPDTPIEIRGTNFAIGMDAAAHGIDVRAIYREGNLLRPAPNPPWGSANLGLEMAAHLSRISSTPTRSFPFRFYACDNWFAGVPWFDYYNREPFDIYCPLSAARLTTTGAAEPATDLEILTINSGYGEMSRTQSIEIEPHIRRAFDKAPDEAGPLVWVYPFAEYLDELHRPDGRLEKSFFGDWYVARAIAGGLPLNTVIETGNLLACAKSTPAALAGRVLVVPTPAADWTYADAVLDLVRRGGKAVFYGSLHDAPTRLREALNVAIGPPIDGDLGASLKMPGDDFAVPPPRRPLRHVARICDGGVCEVLADRRDKSTSVRAVVSKGGERRVYALVRAQKSWKGGALAWIRGSLPFDAAPDSLEPVLFSPAESHDASVWLRWLVADLGIRVRQERRDVSTQPACLFVSRSRGSFFFNGHKPDATVVTGLSFPDGAPVLCERQTYVEGDSAKYHLDRSFHLECQAFVRQKGESLVSHKELRTTRLQSRVFRVGGLKDATVSLYVPREAVRDGRLEVRKVFEYVIHDPTVDQAPKGKRGAKPAELEPLLKYKVDPVTGAAVVKGVTGSIEVRY